jgi:aminopeptidase N
MEILLKEGRAQTLSLLLHSKLRITRIVNLKTGKALVWHEVPYSDWAKRMDVSFKKGEDHLFLSISYEGPIYDPVVKERALQFVSGDETSGLIGSEGVYLSSSSYWFPDRPGSMALFNLEASIPKPFRIVTQGELLSEELRDGIWRSKWRNEWPTESLSLVAGKYSIRSRKVNGVKISTYFFRQDDKFSEIFLDGAEEYLKIYPELLGPFPYRKFDIVQNFFSSGYSFPTFTLLAPEAIRQGKEFLRPGALDHEIVHSWWGHHVSGKPGTGNWSEALTTYCTNYFYKELKLGEEAARKHRHDVMQKYAIQVPPTKDYPLRQFEGKEGEIDGQIGYGKGSMVFHMLRQMVGKDLFFTTLKNVSKKYGGKQATWDDLKTAFEEAGGKKLDQFFSQWLDRPGGPQLKLEKVGYQVTPRGYLISGEVVQQGEIYKVQVEAKVDLGERGKDLLLDISKRKNSFSIEVPRIPISFTLDPDHHIFRRLYPEEIIPGLNAMLEDSDKIFVIPGGGDEEGRKIYTELARMAKERKGGEILFEREVTAENISNSSLMLLGESWKNSLFSKLISKLPSPIVLKEGNFIVDGEKVDEAEESLLLTYPHPLKSGKWVTIYFGQSASSLSRARYIFFYGWDSYVLFEKGRPNKRGRFSPLRSFISYNFMTVDRLNEMQPLESKR